MKGEKTEKVRRDGEQRCTMGGDIEKKMRLYGVRDAKRSRKEGGQGKVLDMGKVQEEESKSKVKYMQEKRSKEKSKVMRQIRMNG